jgi:two-component system, NtrC family, response regulator AtoC
MTKINKILIIDDDADYRHLLATRLKSLYTEAEIIEYDILTKNEFPSEEECSQYDVLILDHDLRGDKTGISWYNSCYKKEDFPATILMTSLGNQTTAMYALNSGIHYYLIKQKVTEEILGHAIEKAIATREMRLLISSQCE